MRAREFISEDRRYRREAGGIPAVFYNANPGALSGRGMDRNYDLYRAGMLMAAGPDQIKDLDPASWINNHAYFGTYTEADREKVRAALKALNLPVEELVSPGSVEHEDVQKQSPIKGFRGYPR
jgi:hypothetical protein